MAKKLVDVTKEPQALTEDDVNAQDSATRLWQSLSTTYGQRTDDSNKAYDKSISAAGRAAQQRGMGRSSYAVQTMANLGNEKATAADRINQELIADYQNRLTSLEQQEREEAFQREQFEYQKERNDVADQQWQQQFGYQQQRDTTADQQWQLQFDTSKDQWQQQFDYGKQRDTVGDKQWQKSFDQQNKSTQQQVAIQYINTMLASGGKPSDALLKQAGLSRADYNAMKQKRTAVLGGGGGKNGKNGNNQNGNALNGLTWEQYLASLDNPDGARTVLERVSDDINGKKKSKKGKK